MARNKPPKRTYSTIGGKAWVKEERQASTSQVSFIIFMLVFSGVLSGAMVYLMQGITGSLVAFFSPLIAQVAGGLVFAFLTKKNWFPEKAKSWVAVFASVAALFAASIITVALFKDAIQKLTSGPTLGIFFGMAVLYTLIPALVAALGYKLEQIADQRPDGAASSFETEVAMPPSLSIDYPQLLFNSLAAQSQDLVFSPATRQHKPGSYPRL